MTLTTAALVMLLAAGPAHGREAALHLREGLALMEREAFGDAETHIRKAAALAPRAVEPPFALGRLMMATERPGEAEVAFRRCLANLDAMEARAGRARSAPATLAAEHDADLDRNRLRRQRAEVHLRLGSAQFQSGDPGGAEASFRKSLALLKSGEGHNNLAVVLLATGRSHDAAREIEAAQAAGYRVSPLLRGQVRAAALPAP